MSLNDINCCIIIPTYNNEKTLEGVVAGVLQHTSAENVIVVNDGSTDGTNKIIELLDPSIIRLGYEKNIGKGYALRMGFKEALSRGYDNAITIDSDGQHFPEDLPKFVQAAQEHPGALIMGSRNMEQSDVPGKSSFGNKFSNFWFLFETGIKLPDTQTGYRLYPLAPIKKIRLFTKKFETEIELIVKMAWANVPIIPISVKVIYEMEHRVSHFRPFKDFTRISILNTYLVILTLLYYLHKRLILKVYNKGFYKLIKEEAFKKNEGKVMKAASIGFGFFIGLLPIWGFQLIVGIPLSIALKMNKVLFLAAAHISIPPMIPLIIYVSYYLGGIFMEEDVVSLTDWDELSLDSIHLNFIQYCLGAILLSVVTGLGSFLVALGVMSGMQKK